MSRFRSLLLVGVLSSVLGAGPLAAAPSLMENLGRGVVAVRASETEVFVSWRVLGTDYADTAFNLYRATGGGEPVRLNAGPISGASNFTDTTADLTQANTYSVRPIVFGEEQAAGGSYTLPAAAPVQQYLRVPLQRPAGGTTPTGEAYTYSPNDASVGDLDGDGEYELVIKWEPSNARDASNDGFTGNTYIDAYRFDGTQLWRIDLGVNVRAGPHDTPFFVYDLDGDGRAEVFMRTAEGTRDGVGGFVADPAKYHGPYPAVVDHTADRRSYPSNGRALVGPEFLTIFNGLTGAEVASTRYAPARHPDTDFPTSQQLFDIWGDSFGNRQGRHYSPGVAYLDGQRPSIVMGRGYAGGQSGHPGRSALAAWNFRDGAITPLWQVAVPGGSGAHSSSVADLDGDGRDDIVYGQNWIRHDGTVIERPSWGHGDALHVSQMDPDRPGQMVFMPHESPGSYGPNALSVDDGATGALIAGVQAGGDIGRGVAADIDPRFRGYEFWGSGGTGGLYNVQNVTPNAVLGPRAVPVSPTKPSSINHAVWWDGDLLRELLDNVSIRKWDWNAGVETTIFAPPGILSNNGTKSNPSLQADIFGDWREEVIWRESTNDAVRIYTTTIPTEHRIHTLMHDRQYRVAIAWQNVGYNQPPHPSFFLGHEMPPPPTPDIVTSLSVLLGPPAPVLVAISDDTGASDSDFLTNDTTLLLAGTAQPGAVVNITRLGAGLVGTAPVDAGGTWVFDYTGTTLPEGVNSFVFSATDGSGNTGATSRPRAVTIDTTAPDAPALTAVSLEAGALVFSGTAEPGSLVEVSGSAGSMGSAVADELGLWTVVHAGPPPPAGPQAFTAAATDPAGNTGAASAGFAVNTALGTPVISGVADDTGASAADGITRDNTLAILGTADPDATVRIALGGLGILGATTADATGAWTFDHSGTVLADGAYAFTATATSAAGDSPSSPAFLVTVDTVAPAILSINRQAPTAATTSAAQLVFRATFSEPVVGLDASDFTLVATGDLAGTISAIDSVSDGVVDITINPVTGEGTLRLDLAADATGIADLAGNLLPGGFSDGQTYTRSLTGDGVWIRSDTGGAWGANANWTEGIVGSGVGTTANFATLELLEDNTVHLDGSRTIGNLVLGDTDISSAASWTIDDAGDPAHVLTFAVNAGTPTIQVNPLGLGATATISTSVAGTQGLTKLGTGTLRLTAPNTVSGTLGVSAGTLQLDGGGLAVGTVNISSGGARLHLVDGSFSAAGTLTVNAGSGSALIVDGGNASFATLATNNSAGGLLRINGGVVTATSVNLPRSNDNNLNFGSGFVVAGGHVTVSGVIGLGTNNSNGVMSVEGGTLVAQGPIRVGALGSNSTRGGAMRVTAGRLTSTDAVEGIAVATRNANTSVVSFLGGVTTAERITLGGAGVTTGSATVNFTGGAVYLGSGGITTVGTQTTRAINLGSATIGATADWTLPLPATLANGATTVVRTADEDGAPHTITFAGVLSGAGNLTKTGSGALALTAANTYTGATVVAEGLLDLDGSVAGSVGVQSGGAISGVGSIGGALTLDPGSTLAADPFAPTPLAVAGALASGGSGVRTVVLTPSATPEVGAIYTLATFGSTDLAPADFDLAPTPGFLGVLELDAGALTLRITGVGPTAEFTHWAFLAGLPPGQDGPDDNPSGDGTPNLLKFVLGLDPLAPAPEGIAATTVMEAGAAYPAIAYTRRTALGGVTVEVLVSPDLGFTTLLGAVEVSATDHGDGTETVVARSLVPLAEQPEQFFRLAATLPAN